MFDLQGRLVRTLMDEAQARQVSGSGNRRARDRGQLWHPGSTSSELTRRRSEATRVAILK